MTDSADVSHVSLPASTTQEEDRKTAGQRKVNLWWEFTQATLAIIVVGGYVYTEVLGKPSTSLAALSATIITLYFVRTNHTKTGGVGGSDSR